MWMLQETLKQSFIAILRKVLEDKIYILQKFR